MRNYDLTFFDKKIENQYLEFQQSSRFNTFKIVTFGLLVTFLIRVVMCFVDNNFSWFYYKLGMVFYLIIQYLLMLCRPKLIRMALIITNIATIGFFLDEEDSIQVSNLRSSNVMAINLMIILTGEFVDSIFQAGIITILKLYITFNNSQINYPIFISTIFVNFSLLYYTYTYHKGKRSQFLLGLVETGWDKIFFQIIKESCILLSFSYQNLNFNILRFKKFPFSLTNQIMLNESQEKQILNFLCNSSIGSISFQQYLLDCVKTLHNSKENLLFRQNYIKFKRKVFLVNLSIFQTKTPMILLQLKEKNKVSQKQLKSYQKRFISLNNSFLNILGKIENELQDNLIIKQLKRKLMLVKIIEELLHDESTFKFVDISNIIAQLKILYLDKQILFENWINLQTINTVPNAFFLLFLVVIENSLINIVQIRILKLENEQSYMVEFSGNFNNNQIKKIYQNTRYQTRLITSDTYISKHLVQFILYSDPLCSSTEDLFIYEYQDLLFSNEQ